MSPASPCLDPILEADKYPRLFQQLSESSGAIIPKGQYLFRQGDIPKQLAVTVSGQLEVSYIDEEGNYVIIEKCSAGFWFGDAAFIDGNALPYTACALSDTRVLGVSHQVIRSQPELENEVYRFVARTVVARLRIMYGKFDSMATRPLNERLLQRLKQLCGDTNLVNISHDDLASYLGVSRHKVSRAMKALDNQGVIKQSYRKVEIKR